MKSPKLCGELLYGKGGFVAACTVNWGSEHSHNDFTAEQSVACGLAVKVTSGNSIQVITPYKRNGIWQFDDERTGLKGEAFVAGADEFIEQLADTVGRVKSRSGFNLLFSHLPFPGHQLHLEHEKPGEMKCGNYYIHRESGKRGWLCPALLLYFKEAPKHLYAQAKPISRK